MITIKTLHYGIVELKSEDVDFLVLEPEKREFALKIHFTAKKDFSKLTSLDWVTICLDGKEFNIDSQIPQIAYKSALNNLYIIISETSTIGDYFSPDDCVSDDY